MSSTVKVTSRQGRLHVDYGDPNGARATISPMETALALEVQRLAGGAQASGPDVVGDRRARRRLRDALRDAEDQWDRAAAATLDADTLQDALIGLLAAIDGGEQEAVAIAVQDARELLADLAGAAAAPVRAA